MYLYESLQQQNKDLTSITSDTFSVVINISCNHPDLFSVFLTINTDGTV